MLTADDPRHGKYAGYIAHFRHDVPMCDPCALAGRRSRKLLHLRGPQTVRLGEAAWKLLQATPPNAIAAALGVHKQRARQMRAYTPDTMVYRRTRAAILAARPTTPIGIVRRVQGLAFLGYSCADLARRSEYVAVGAFKRIRREEVARCFVRTEVASEIVRIYDELHMTPAPPSAGATRTRQDAERNGWASPMAWDDIDDPDEQPHLDDEDSGQLDEAAIWRRMHGDKRVPLTTEERDEVVRRCLADGWKWLHIEQRTGVSVSQFRERERERETAA